MNQNCWFWLGTAQTDPAAMPFLSLRYTCISKYHPLTNFHVCCAENFRALCTGSQVTFALFISVYLIIPMLLHHNQALNIGKSIMLYEIRTRNLLQFGILVKFDFTFSFHLTRVSLESQTRSRILHNSWCWYIPYLIMDNQCNKAFPGSWALGNSAIPLETIVVIFLYK